MRNIRFGKDITTRWRIKTNGEHESLLGRDLHLILTDQFGNKSELPFVISDTNLVTFVWFGKDHKRYGHHIITLFENFGVEGQTAVDAVEYVNLVEYTTQENNATYDNLSMETVELEGDIATSGRGLNNYELWILDGHQGSLADYLQWARGDKGDPGEDGKPLTWDDLTDEQKESLRGLPGADGADAKINGVNTVRIIQGKNMQINQSGSTMTFDSIPDPASILRTHLAYDVQDSLKKADDVDKKVDKTALDALSAKIGNLSSLSTSAKNNLVSAINEIVTSTPQIYATNLRSSVNDDIFTDAAPWLTMVLDNINGHGSIIMYNTNPRCQEYLYGNIKVDAFGLYTLTFYTFRASAMEVATATLDLEEQRIEPISHDTFSISSINATLAQKQDKINDLATIRSGAAKGATAYQKPSTGIPESDLSLDVKDKLNAGGSSVNVVDNLASDSATDALSAKQGKALKSLVDGKATDTAVLHKTGDESASGKKTFTDGMQAPVVEVGEGTAVATISPIVGIDGNTGFMFAGKKGNAELAGVGTPTTSSSATNKKYVDDALANKASSSDLASLSSKIGELESEVDAGVTASASSASMAEQKATEASQSATQAATYLNDVKTAMQSLPEGSAVSAQVAVNTAKVAEITRVLPQIREILTYRFSNFTDGVFFNTSLPEGTAVSPGSNSGFASIVLDCSEGDIIKIVGVGGASGRLWCFAHDDIKISASGAGAGNIEDGVTITAPTGANRVYINISKSATPNYTDIVMVQAASAPILQDIEDFVDKKIACAKKELKILCFGNSFTIGAMAYVPSILSNIAPNIKITIGIAYTSALSLQKLWEILSGSKTPLGYYKYKNGAWTNGAYAEDNIMSYILGDEAWDIVTFQQNGQNADGEWDTLFSPYIFQLHKVVAKNVKKSIRFGWLLTHGSYPSADRTIRQRWEGTAENSRRIIKDTASVLLFPYGTAVENLRTTSLSSLGDYGFLQVDSAHLQDGIGALCAAYTSALVIADYLGEKTNGVINISSIVDDDFLASLNRPQGFSYTGTGIIGMNPSNLFLAQVACECAINEPYQLTDLSSYEI